MINLNIEQIDDIIIIHLSGSFNIENLSRVEAVWMDQVCRNPRIIALDCGELEGLDSSAIGSIVQFFNFAMNRNIQLTFYDLKPIIQKLFSTARLNRYFNITTKHEFENRCSAEAPSLSPDCNKVR